MASRLPSWALPGAASVTVKEPVGQGEIRAVSTAWVKAAHLCARAGYRRAPVGMRVVLIRRSTFVAQCWDDHRLVVNVPRLLREDAPHEVLVHELGHEVWFQCLSERERQGWQRDYEARVPRSARRGSYGPRRYGDTNEIEDFAECFRMVVLGRASAVTMTRWRRLTIARRS